MSFDNLVDAAESNGGMASQAINLQRVIVNRKIEKSDHRLVNKPIFKGHPAGPSSLAKYIPPIELDTSYNSDDLLQKLEKENRLVKALKESRKNSEERTRRLNIVRARQSLARYKIRPLLQPQFDSRVVRNLPVSLVNIAKCLAKNTGLDPLGICLAILGSVSIATWGRVSITLTPEWSEPAVDMLLHVSSSGTRKSSLASFLRMPFEQYCAQANDGAEVRMRHQKRELTLLKKAAEKRAHQKIVTVLNGEKE